jgi:hypothetical protein
MISFKEYLSEVCLRAVMRRHGSVKPGHWHSTEKRFVSDKESKGGFDHDRLVSINAEVEVNGKIVAGKRAVNESVAQNKYDYEWDQNHSGYHVTKNGQRVKDAFYKAKSQFDRGEADTSAKKHAQKLKTDEISAERNAREHDVQINKPLSEIEKRWVNLQKKLVMGAKKQGPGLNDDELKKYSSYGSIVRKSLRDGSHPALKADE